MSRTERTPGILLGREALAGGFDVPVGNPPDEGRDQEDAGVGAGDRLRPVEDQRQVAVDARALQLLRGADAFPGGGELHQDALAADLAVGIVLNDLLGAGDRGGRVERKVGVHLGRDASGDELGERRADRHGQAIGDGGDTRFRLAGLPRTPGDGIVHRVLELGGSEGLQHDRGVGRAVDGPQPPHGLDVAGVGDHRCHRAQLIES